MEKRIYTSKLGFTLVEVIIAIGLLSMTVVGPLYFATNSINTGLASKNQLVAFYLAQEAIEYVKAVRDGNFYGGDNWINGGNLSLCNGSDCIVDAINNDIQTLASYNDCGVEQTIKYDEVTGYYNHNNDGECSIFKRFVLIDNVNSDEARVIVAVTWDERMLGIRTVVLEEHIFNWNIY